jgi:hypothetical protein
MARLFGLLLAVAIGVAVSPLTACSKGSPPVPSAAGASTPAPSSEFDRKWTGLAATDVETFYVGDDRGEGLMGNVRRTKRPIKVALVTKGALDPDAPPEVPSPDEIEQVIRQNLAGVSACYLRLSRTGDQRSGKAIVSFQIGAAGDVQKTKVEAPAFDGTTLPSCVSGLVSHWAFPRSAKGGLAISYPFVFVGG